MSSWVVSGAGVSAYDGTYSESGTYDSAPAYVSAGGKWMYKTGEDAQSDPVYSLGPTKGDVSTVYVAADGPLPGAYWMAAVEGIGEPAPTVAEADTGTPALDDPYNIGSYDNWWWPGAAFGVGSPIKPAVCTLDGTAYMVFARPEVTSKAFLLVDLEDANRPWHSLDTAAAIFAAGKYDEHQGGGVFDAGDGLTVHVLSGGYVDGGQAKFACATYELVPYTSATEV